MTSRAAACEANVRQLIDQAIAEGTESAVQVAAYLDGELVLDVWAAPEGWEVDGETLFPIFSTGKGIAATAIHRLVERGVLAWDDSISRWWPEFAAAGKVGITLRHALKHTAGMPMMPETSEEAPASDWEAMCAYLAAATPVNAPGARRYYHAITYSWLLGETARQADGRDFHTIIREEVLQPLGIRDLYFGVPDGELGRCLDAEKARPCDVPPPPAEPPPPPDPVAQRAIPEYVWPLEDWINRREVRQACIPASNGFGTARALARKYAGLVGEGVDGVRLLGDETLAAATAWDAAAEAEIPGPGRWGLGYGLQGPDERPGMVFGTGGYGGSTGFADSRYGLAVGLVKSRMGGGLTGQVVAAIREGLGTPA